MHVTVRKTPLREWTCEPTMYTERLSFLATFTVHIYIYIFLLACSVSLFVQYRSSIGQEGNTVMSTVKLVSAIALITGLICFSLYNSSYYIRLATRIRCYNNPVIDVFDMAYHQKTKTDGVEFDRTDSFTNFISKFSTSNNKVSNSTIL